MAKVQMSQKQEFVDALMAVRRNGQRLEIALRFKKKKDEADQVWEATTRLSSEIDILIGRIMDDWVEESAEAIESLTDASGKIDESIEELKKKTANIEKVIKVIGLIDDAVDLAKKALAVL